MCTDTCLKNSHKLQLAEVSFLNSHLISLAKAMT